MIAPSATMITATWLNSIWNSVDNLSSVVTKANWGIATTLLFGCVFTAISIIAGNRKDELLKVGDLEREERIAQAKGLAADANERSVKLEVTAEQARLEQKRLEVDVERSRAEQEKVRQENLKLSIRFEAERTARLQLEERLSPRKLMEAQRLAIDRVLRSAPKQKVRIMTIMNSVEAGQYAESFKLVLENAGWTVDGINQGMFSPTVPIGIWILVKDARAVPLAADILAKAFHDAGIQTQGAANPQLQTGEVELRIGAKP